MASRTDVAIGTAASFTAKQYKKQSSRRGAGLIELNGSSCTAQLHTRGRPVVGMRLSGFRYTLVLVVQLALLAIDLLFNTFIHRYLANTGISILLFVLQDIGQLVAIAVLLITFFQTNIFQAGFIVLLFNEFRSTIITGVGYFILTLFVQVWTLTNRFKGQVYFYWPDGLYVFFVLHKFTSCLHYYLYKRTALCISDPKFYTDEWINHRINQESDQRSPKY